MNNNKLLLKDVMVSIIVLGTIMFPMAHYSSMIIYALLMIIYIICCFAVLVFKFIYELVKRKKK